MLRPRSPRPHAGNRHGKELEPAPDFVFLLEPACYFAGSSLIFLLQSTLELFPGNFALLEPVHIFPGS